MMKVKIAPETNAGKIRPLHGMNLGAPVNDARISHTVSDFLRRLEIPLTRMHDCPLNNPGMRLVDIPCVFPFFQADASNPANYYFGQTDDYLENCLNYGSKIMYRLGVSIEHSRKHYWTSPPEDPSHWAEICAGIIRHYNEGWAEGFQWGIEYWEIWNEADTELPILWDGTWKQFIEFYSEVALDLKKKFPHLKIGGPSMAKLTNRDGLAVREFLQGCRDKGVPLDFFTWHQYSDKPEKLIEAPFAARKLLDEYDFTDTELHLSEWKYHAGWGADCDSEREDILHRIMVGPDSAAFFASVVIGWQDSPMTMSEYYTGSTGKGYSLFNPFGIPHCAYHAIDWFNQLCHTEKRLETFSSRNDTSILAGKNGNRIQMLVSAFKSPQDDITFEFDGLVLDPNLLKVTILDFQGKPKNIQKEISVSENIFSLEKVSGSTVFWIEYGK